jgi:hypothetical protein
MNSMGHRVAGIPSTSSGQALPAIRGRDALDTTLILPLIIWHLFVDCVSQRYIILSALCNGIRFSHNFDGFFHVAENSQSFSRVPECQI